MVDGQEQWTDFLVANSGDEDIILGLPWLQKTNPQIDWEKGHLSVKTLRVTIEDIPEEPGSDQIAVNTIDGSLLESMAPSLLPSFTQKEQPLSELCKEEEPPLYQIQANWALRCSWVKAGIMQNTTKEVWCTAGCTYSQQLAEQAHQNKPM